MNWCGRRSAVVANFMARVLPGPRLTYEDLRSANERILLVHMPALGGQWALHSRVRS